MSNKTLIPLIIILSLITIGVASLTQFNKAPEKIAINTNQSSEITSSVKTQGVSSSSLVPAQVISSSTVSSAQKAVESLVKPQQEIKYDENRIAFLSNDKSKLPKSVIQFLDCSTKMLKKHYGAFIIENGEEVYKCPPKIESLSCKFNISYLIMPSKPSPITFDDKNQPIYPEDFDLKEIISEYKTGWTCDLMYPLGVHSDGGFTCILTENKDYYFQYSTKQNSNNEKSCYAIPTILL
jgi:hypothetical protein